MDSKYNILDEKTLALPEIYNLRLKLERELEEKNEITRNSAFSLLGIEPLKEALVNINHPEDPQKSIDDLIGSLMKSIDNGGSIFTAEICSCFQDGKCKRTKYSESAYKGRKLCDKRDYTIYCEKISLKKISG
jgi:hypothetical protein